MKKHYLFVSLLSLSAAAQAQFTERQVISAQGGVYENQQANLAFSSTIGETIVLTKSSAAFILHHNQRRLWRWKLVGNFNLN